MADVKYELRDPRPKEFTVNADLLYFPDPRKNYGDELVEVLKIEGDLITFMYLTGEMQCRYSSAFRNHFKVEYSI